MNKLRLRLLKILHDNKGQYISGEDISNRLRVSRTAIWKHIKILRDNGYNIDSRSKCGYTLLKVPDKIIPEEILLDLPTEYIGQNIRLFERIDSTNKKAKILAEKGIEKGAIVIAEEQCEGKGRLGREWYSPPGTGLWFSLILKPDFKPDKAPFLTIVASLAVVDVLGKYKLNPEIKWPNDILLADKKVCGILSEMSAELDRINYAIIGIGINVNQKVFPDYLKNTATSVRINFGDRINRNVFLKKLLISFAYYYDLLLTEERKKLLSIWEKKLNLLNKNIKIKSRGASCRGRAIGVSEKGELLVKTQDGLKSFWAGDATLHQK